MSNVSNTHQFQSLDKNSKPLSGQRLVRLIAKADKNGNYPSPNLSSSLCVSVPHVGQDDIVQSIDRLVPHIVGMVKDTQDKIIREWRIENGRDEIPEETFSVDNCIAWLDANAAGDRVTVEYLAEWFADTYGAIAGEWIAAQLKVSATDTAVSQKVAVLRDMFAGWASPKYSPNIPKLKAMIKFCDVAGDAADTRLTGYRDKCVDMLTRKEAELTSDALGF